MFLPFLLLACCTLQTASEQVRFPAEWLPAVAQAQQMILVRAPDWESARGELACFERFPAGDWVALPGKTWPVSLGRNGLGWGRGLHPEAKDSEEPVKREGDGKAPAGIFSLGEAFGYAERPDQEVELTYRQCTELDFFVDDKHSADYNRWVRLEEGVDPRARWGSFERMKRADGLYAHGIVVRHNMDPVVPGMGSAIFLHIWQGPSEATAGCTAMAEADLRWLLRWLDPAKNPVFVQLPRTKEL